MPQSRLHVPVTEEITAAMKIAETSVEASEYLVERVTKILTETKMLDNAGDLLTKLQDFAKYVGFKLNASSQIWSGQATKPTDFKNLQNNIAADAIKTVKANAVGDIKLDIAISTLGKILRGYSAGGQQIKDPAVLEALDKLFNAWLAEHNIVSRASILYEANAKGEVKHDGQGEVHINPESIKKLMDDPEKGFAKYAKEKALNMEVDNRHEYPAEQAVEKQQPTPPAASEESIEITTEGPKL